MEWISAKDKLPDVNNLVLLCINNSSDMAVGWMDTYGDFNPSYVINSGYDMSEPFIEGNVTHWMPLPEPPKQ